MQVSALFRSTGNSSKKPLLYRVQDTEYLRIFYFHFIVPAHEFRARRRLVGNVFEALERARLTAINRHDCCLTYPREHGFFFFIFILLSSRAS